MSGLELRHHQPNDPTGFSASVFFNRTTSKYVLSIRGTEQPLADLFGEDLSRIGLHGFASDQMVSLYRYYRKLTTPVGQPVTYTSREFSLLSALRNGLPLTLNFASSSPSIFKLELDRDTGLAPLSGGGSVIPQGAPLTVTGHSLGGHLALLFGRAFPDVTEQIYTYNAPGIGKHGALALGLLGLPAVPSQRIVNVAASMGAEAISRIWSRPGEKIAAFTESSSPFNHSVIPLTDSLALYGVFAQLSLGLAADPATVSRILSAASAFGEESLEVTLDHLRSLLGFTEPSTPVTISDLANRDGYYQNLYQLLDGRAPGRDYAIVPLADRSAGDLARMAASAVSVRFALDSLMPFAAGNADYSAYTGSFSSQWIAARAEMLAGMVENNLIDRAYGLAGSGGTVFYRDIDMDERFALLDTLQRAGAALVGSTRAQQAQYLDAQTYSRTVVFGSDSADAGAGDNLIGTPGNDRLFGQGGGDQLQGGAGEDYLEGGAEIDALYGGPDADTLDGGAGADRLEGGEGRDTYLYESLDGDTIVDRDGSIFVDSALLTGGSGQGGQYTSSDGRFSYSFSGDLAAGGTLLVNGVLRVENFRDGDLGIRLFGRVEVDGVSVPQTEVTLRGDIVYEAFNRVPNDVDPETLDAYGNPAPGTEIEASPDRADASGEFPGTPGNTHYVMGGGNDQARDTWGGNDWIELGSGDDAGFGGDGNDVLEGGSGRDSLSGGSGNDILIAGSIGTRIADLADTAVAPPNPMTGMLSGGADDDTLYGDAEGNILVGGIGQDEILAGAGNDWIGGDFDGATATGPGSSPRFPLPAFSAVEPVSGAGADAIDAGPGNDTIYAGGGDDLVFAGDGDDWINGGTGADTLLGGAGRDWMIVSTAEAVGDFLDGGEGNDEIVGGPGDDILIGGGGDDFLLSNPGADLLLGGDGRDTLVGSGGDLLDGGAGDDFHFSGTVAGEEIRIRWGSGLGNDTAYVSLGTLTLELDESVFSADISVAEVDGAIEVPIPPSLPGVRPSIETRGYELRLGSTGETLTLFEPDASFGSASLSLEFADGTIWDRADIESLLSPGGGEEAETITAGTADAEILYGTDGADTVAGLLGDDWLSGGAGDDIYRYAAGDGFDRIEDFDSVSGNSDSIELASGIAPTAVEVFASGGDYILSMEGGGGMRLLGGRTPEGAIESVGFADGTRWTAADLEARAEILPGNRSPQMPGVLGRVSVDPGEDISFTLSEELVTDADRFDSLSYYAISGDGERLPEWLSFDAATLTVSGTSAQGDAGSLDVLLFAVDESGEAAFGTLTIEVGAAESTGTSATPVQFIAAAAPESIVDDASPAPTRATESAAARRQDVSGIELAQTPSESQPSRIGVPSDPVARDMQERLDVLLQTGRTNLGERYAEAVREFEERRQQREEAPPPPPPTDEEIEAWNTAMHAWHDRHSGFGEADLGAADGGWAMGWGLPASANAQFDGGSAGLPSLANPHALPRLAGAGAKPGLGEGIRDIG